MQPEGFVKEGHESMVYRLLKALYGLKQAPRDWYAKLSGRLEGLGFVKCPYEPAVYTKHMGGESLIMGVYVDLFWSLEPMWRLSKILRNK